MGWKRSFTLFFALHGKCTYLPLGYYVMSVLYSIGKDYRLNEFRRLFFHVRGKAKELNV